MGTTGTMHLLWFYGTINLHDDRVVGQERLTRYWRELTMYILRVEVMGEVER